MLKALREGGTVTKALMGTVVVLIIAAFALDYRTSAPPSGDECVAQMDGECLELSDYQTLLRLVAPPGATNRQLRELGFVQSAVDALVERELLLREAERLGVSVSEDELDNLLLLGQVHFSWPADAPIPQALAAGRPFPKTGAAPTLTYLRVRNSETDAFDYEIYRRQIQNRLRLSPKNFKEAQHVEVVAARVRALVTNPVRVSETEVFNQYVRDNSNATARVVEAKAAWFQRFGKGPTEVELDAFLKEKAALVDEAWTLEEKQWTADCPLVSELSFEYPPGADDAAKAETQARADKALALLKGEVEFGVVARVASDAPNAVAGGALGCLRADYGPSGAELVAAVERLSPGQVSAALETPKGLHVFLFHGKLDAEAAKTLGRRAVARAASSEQAAQESAKAFAAALIEASKAGGDLESHLARLLPEYVRVPVPEAFLGEILTQAKEHEDAPRVEVSRTFTAAGAPVYGAKADPDVAKKVFALAIDAVLGEAVETHAGWAVVQLKEKTVATREEFDKEKAERLKEARELRRSEVLVSYLGRLRAQVKEVKLNPKHTSAEQDGTADTPGGSG